MTEGIGPGKQRNRFIAVWLTVMSVFPLFIGFSAIPMTRPDEWALPAMFLLPGLLLLGWALWLWRKPQGRAASIDFTAQGFTLSRFRSGQAASTVAVDWQDVRELRHYAGGYGARGIEILLTHSGAKKADLVLDTTREDASDFLAKRKLSAHGMDFEPPLSEVIERLVRAAEAAGFQVEKASLRYYFVVSVERWLIRKP